MITDERLNEMIEKAKPFAKKNKINEITVLFHCGHSVEDLYSVLLELKEYRECAKKLIIKYAEGCNND